MSSIPQVRPAHARSFISQRLSLRQLRVLSALNDKGSIAAAAEALHLTPTAVSKTLSEMEQAMGYMLFSRTHRNMQPTALGRSLVSLSNRMEANLLRSSEEVESLLRGATGELHVGASQTALLSPVFDVIAQLKAETPMLSVHLHTGTESELFEAVRNGHLDLVIACDTDRSPKDLMVQPLQRIRQVVAISTNHPLASRRRIGWDTLNAQAWICHNPGTHSKDFRDCFWQRLGLPPPSNLLQTNDLAVALDLLRLMPLVSLLPQHVAQSAARNGIVRLPPLDLAMGASHVCLWHRPGPQSEPVQRFRQLLADMVN